MSNARSAQFIENEDGTVSFFGPFMEIGGYAYQYVGGCLKDGTPFFKCVIIGHSKPGALTEMGNVVYTTEPVPVEHQDEALTIIRGHIRIEDCPVEFFRP